MMRIAGVVLNLLGVLSLWFGGVPYKTRETVLDIGPLKATTEVEKKAEIPPPIGAGLVGGGTVLLLLAGLGSRKRS
ncbi:MAG: DUF3185 domain-containing protein [Archangiaceae bacterium]|nr:DUF3185 domain-containing protein [Archangiaceae bacterium]